MKKILVTLLILVVSYQLHAQDTVKVKTNLTPEQEAETVYNTALEMMGKKEYAAAIENFTKAIALNPLFDKAFLNRGFAKYENKNNEAAIEDFNSSNSMKPSADAYFGKAQCFYVMNKKDSCAQNLAKATILDDKYAKAYYLQGQLNFENQQYKEAVEAYDKAIAAKPD